MRLRRELLDGGLYPHQRQAVEAWKGAGKQGILRMVTGSGKTVAALACIEEACREDPKVQAHVIVPTVSLLNQWKSVFLKMTDLGENEIGLYYGGAKDDPLGKTVMLYVINSAADFFAEKGGGLPHGFLVVDECHRSGASTFKRIYRRDFKYLLGLSATPEREYDDAFEKHIAPNLGPVVFKYSFTQAVRDGIIPPYEINIYPVHLSAGEKKEYDETTEKMKKAMARLRASNPALRKARGNQFFACLNGLMARGNSLAKSAWSLMMARSHLLFDAEGRKEAVVDILAHERGSRSIVFHEKIEGANELFNRLRACGFKAGRYHTGISKKRREKWFRAFKKGAVDILVTCKAFDEGIDVPAIDVGIIAAGTSGNRQMIQRSGRALRGREGKELSRIYVVYVEGVKEENDLMSDDGRMSEIAQAATQIYRIRRKT